MMDYDKPSLNETNLAMVNGFLWRLVDQLNEHERMLRLEIEELKKGMEDGIKNKPSD